MIIFYSLQSTHIGRSHFFDFPSLASVSSDSLVALSEHTVSWKLTVLSIFNLLGGQCELREHITPLNLIIFARKIVPIIKKNAWVAQ